ncbi:MAG: hypothetical protein NTY64_14230 [Deltaproteobacteria bacterium]|nr:hypothetical protein [Deltaproteobacteria bacterium]
MPKVDGFVKSPSAALPCILRRCSLLRNCAPCIWSFLLCHPDFDFLRVHQS